MSSPSLAARSHRLSEEQARALTDEVKRDAESLWGKLVELYEGGAHLALGYSSWGAYFEVEFGGSRRRGYELLQAGRVVEVVRNSALPVPRNEAQANELAPLLGDERKLVEVVRELHAEYPGQVTAERVRRLVRSRLRREEREREAERIRSGALLERDRLRDVLRIGDGIEVHHGDFRDLDIPSQTADLFFCDPPYVAEFVPVWSDLGAFAARVLKPGRLLVAYSGNLHVREALAGLGEHLEFVTVGAVFLPGGHALLHGRRVFATSKPLLFFSAGRYCPRRPFQNGWWARKPEKETHVWQQETSCAGYYVEVLTEPGELVIDPFVGGGTTAVVCRDLGRRFVGCDVDRASVDATESRLGAVAA